MEDRRAYREASRNREGNADRPHDACACTFAAEPRPLLRCEATRRQDDRGSPRQTTLEAGRAPHHALVRPRTPRSGWSKPNKERVERLISAGLMHPAGLAKIEAAKRDGSWTALDAIERLEIPPDLAVALDRFPDARRHFEGFPPSARRGILEWISTARRPETRARRVEETATLADRNERANQWRGRSPGG